MSTKQFTAEFDRLSAYLRAFAFKLTRDQQGAQDLFQDTAFLAFKHREKFAADSNLKAWLATIMRNTFINGIRKMHRRKEILDHTPEQYLIHSGTQSARNEGEPTVLIEELTQLIEQLDTDLKHPFLLFYQGFKYEEISKLLGLPLGTTKSRIFQARKRLKAKLQAFYSAKSTSEIAA